MVSELAPTSAGRMVIASIRYVLEAGPVHSITALTALPASAPGHPEGVLTNRADATWHDRRALDPLGLGVDAADNFLHGFVLAEVGPDLVRWRIGPGPFPGMPPGLTEIRVRFQGGEPIGLIAERLGWPALVRRGTLVFQP